jgi:hypothetical protein
MATWIPLGEKMIDSKRHEGVLCVETGVAVWKLGEFPDAILKIYAGHQWTEIRGGVGPEKIWKFLQERRLY